MSLKPPDTPYSSVTKMLKKYGQPMEFSFLANQIGLKHSDLKKVLETLEGRGVITIEKDMVSLTKIDEDSSAR